MLPGNYLDNVRFPATLQRMGKGTNFLPPFAMTAANFAINSLEVVCSDSFFSKFAVVLHQM